PRVTRGNKTQDCAEEMASIDGFCFDITRWWSKDALEDGTRAQRKLSRASRKKTGCEKTMCAWKSARELLRNFMTHFCRLFSALPCCGLWRKMTCLPIPW